MVFPVFSEKVEFLYENRFCFLHFFKIAADKHFAQILNNFHVLFYHFPEPPMIKTTKNFQKYLHNHLKKNLYCATILK